jgi:hypothetical protein
MPNFRWAGKIPPSTLFSKKTGHWFFFSFMTFTMQIKYFQSTIFEVFFWYVFDFGLICEVFFCLEAECSRIYTSYNFTTLQSKNLRVAQRGRICVPQCVSILHACVWLKIKLCVLNQHACVSNRHAYMWLKNYYNNNKKAKHGAGACRSKVYVYYYEFEVIFLMLIVELELRISVLHVLRLMHQATV